MKEELINIYFKNINLVFWVILEISIILIIAVILRYFKWSNISTIMELIYEKVFKFYENILWQEEKKWIKIYIVVLFFIILIANLMWIWLEFIAPIFWVDGEEEFVLSHFIKNPTWDLNFTLALSITSIIMLLVIQFSKKWFLHFFLEYFPITWKWYIFLEKWKINRFIYYPIAFVLKIFDIILSFFISFLEILWLLAKSISLAFRLFWNILAWSILVTVIMVSLSLSSKELTSFMWGFSFPIIFPLFIYWQEIIISVVQAFIFPMLIAIFIKTTTQEA